MASLSVLRIRRCLELWCRSQKWLGSHVSVAVAMANSCSSGLTPSLGTSICHGGRPTNRKKSESFYCCCIKTSKYNAFNFLPVNLFEQFQRLANAYFLFLLFLQLIPQIASLAWYTTVMPLMVVLSITAVKDAIDDLVMWLPGPLVPHCPFLIFLFPLPSADILLLSSSEPYSLTYIETAELDGTLIPSFCFLFSFFLFFSGEVRCECPNNKLDRFTGILTYRGKNYILDHDRLILRGCVIRNTDWCYGLVIFTGPDTKLMQNSGKLLSVSLQIGSMCFILAIGHCIWENKKGYYFQDFLPWKEYVSSSVVSATLIFWSYFIILNTMVPISLYVSVEIIRLGNSFYINWDRKMFYEPKNTPAQARTTTLNEELGQVTYVFSDKTGTLTQNIMIFNKCSINGIFYGGVYDKNGQRVEISEKTEKVDFSYNKLADPKFSFYDKTLVEAVKRGDHRVHLFFLSLSLCHTVIPEEKVEGELVYQAQSPDEGALVTAARNFGFVFRSRTSETIMVVEMGETKIYQLLAILDFNNVRKRMSVIVRTPEDRVMLFCKGADTILCQLLHPSCRSLKEVTMDHLDDFAVDGLRTLMVAYRELDNAFFHNWSLKHSEACLSLEDRESEISLVYEEIEKDLMLLGATAIEDKLQDGVPETIITLNKAKIKVWVLTGDKQETAVNIAYACNIFHDEMDGIFIVEGKDNETVQQELRYDGRTATAHALEGNLQLDLLRTACMCKGVICCRMTPLQKAQVVELVKRYKKVVTLAIGDGANDVSMIKAAHIGVGISGQEGMQAMLNSDFAFSQFHHLQRLLFVHGRWSYNRMCKFLSYFFYKNFAFTLVHFWYAFYSGFSAQTVYDTWFITFYNLVYTSLPVLGLSLFDQDVNETWSLRFPELYEPGQHNLYFNKKEFVKCLLHGIYSSLVLFFIPMGAIYNSVRGDGKEISDYQSFSMIVQTSLLCVVTTQIALETTYWTMISHIFTWGSLGFYFCILFFLYSDGLCLMFPNVFQFLGVARNTLNLPQMWLSIALSMILCMLPVVGIHHCMRHPLPPPIRTKLKHPSSRRSAYAFSHKQGFGALITSGKTLKTNHCSSSLVFTQFSKEILESLETSINLLFHSHSRGSASSLEGTTQVRQGKVKKEPPDTCQEKTISGLPSTNLSKF
uniref:Phospholipid-transporting ATPase n=1 Tax=Catagonus wagneri TaxID=51154 RepID=A0A8C3W4T4_9CETA